MAVTYAGLTIEFGGDTKGLSDALKKIQGEAKTTNSDLKAIEKSLKFNPGNTDLLAQKVRNLNKAYDETKSKLDAYKQAMQQLEAKKERGEQLTEQEQRQYEQLQRSILQAENQLESIEGDIKSTSAEFEASQTKIYQWGQALEDNSVKFEKIGQGMQKVGGAATKYVTAPLIAVGTAAGKAAFDVDEALTGVRKTVDATEDEYKQLRDAAIEYSKTHPISATDILAAEELAGQLGVDKQNLQEFAAVATGLDLATNMNVDQAATNLARFANVTNMSKLEGEDAERAYRSYGNVIVGLGNNLATTESEVSDFSLRMASAGTQAGMTEADILGIAGAMSSVGLEAASGGSAFSKTITDIGIAVATGSEDLEKYAAVAGMSADEFSEYWQKDATGAFIAFINGLANGSEDMNVILEDLGITELRQSDALRRLAGNTDLLTDAVKLANDEWDNGTALADEVAAKGDSVGGKITTLKNKVTALLAKIGEPLLDALTDAIDAAEPFLTTLGDMAQQFADMPKEQQQFILKLAAAAAAFGPVTSAGGKLVENLGTIGTGMKAASTFFAGIGGPAATASTAVGGVATSAGGLSGAWGTMTGFIAAHPIGLGIAAVAAATAGLTYFFTQTETGKQLWSDFTGWVSEKWQGVQDFFAGVPDWWNGVCEGWRQTQEANNQAMNELWEGLKSDAGVLKETVSREWEQMKTDVSNAA
ncbi:MAG: phage tail tape measure protein, partial [Atopobiaceae bacterium]|nr:phage tail tape measure protein [Atopobiaceae bacterium]